MGGTKRAAQTVSRQQAAIEEKLRERLAEVIQKERESAQLTQEQLAAKAGIHWTTVGKVERGRQLPSLALLVLFCDALDVPVTELLAKVLPGHSEAADDATVAFVEELTAAERADLLPVLQTIVAWRRRS